MKKSTKEPSGELRSEYKVSDFPKLVRGKYASQLRRRSNVIILDPELTDLFPNSEAVNSALRSLSEIARRARHPRPV
jgi:hypothetical protein